MSCFEQDMVFSIFNVSEKQAKYQQEEQKRSFRDCRLSKWPWFSLVPRFSVPADCYNYGQDVLGDWSWENNKVNFPIT